MQGIWPPEHAVDSRIMNHRWAESGIVENLNKIGIIQLLVYTTQTVKSIAS